MSDFDGLLASALDDPDDDVPRHLLADWLDEHGDEEAGLRARLIRWQLAWEGLPSGSPERATLAGQAVEVLDRRLLSSGPLATLLQPRPSRLKETAPTAGELGTALVLFLCAGYTRLGQAFGESGTVWQGWAGSRPDESPNVPGWGEYRRLTTLTVTSHDAAAFEGEMIQSRPQSASGLPMTFRLRGVGVGEHVAFVTHQGSFTRNWPGLYVGRIRDGQYLNGTWRIFPSQTGRFELSRQ